MRFSLVLSTLALVSVQAAHASPLFKQFSSSASTAPQPVRAASEPVANPAPKPAPTAAKTLTLGDLKKNPRLFGHVLDDATSKGRFDLVRVLLPQYEALPQHDVQLARYCHAALAVQDGHFEAAIGYFRQMLAQDAKLNPVRLQMAILLMRNHDDAEARKQFLQLRSQKEMPKEVRALINRYLQALAERNEWSFNASANYTYSDNLGNAPPENLKWKGWVFNSKREKSWGIHYELSATRRFSLPKGFYTTLNAGLDGTWWRHGNKYKSLTLGTQWTFGWNDARYDFSLTPYYYYSFRGKKPYYKLGGVSLNASWWLNDNLRFGVNTVASRLHHLERPDASGDNYRGGVTLSEVPNPQTFLLQGLSYTINRAQGSDYSYRGPQLRFMWGQEWPHGLSQLVDFNLSYQRHPSSFYSLVDNSPEKNWLLGANFKLWKRDWHWWGITPKLNLEGSRTISNIGPSNREWNWNAYLSFSRSF